MGRAGAVLPRGDFFDGQFAAELQYKPPTTILPSEDEPAEKPHGSKRQPGDEHPESSLRR